MTLKNHIETARQTEGVPDDKFLEHFRTARKCDKDCRVNSFVQHSEAVNQKKKKALELDPVM